MTTAPVADSPPPPPGTSRTDRFFSWTAGLGVVRGDGWIGGVAAGLAARARIDPLIVRGILVVVALFGFPALFLYGVAWALLPDPSGRIPLQDALRGRFASSQVGAAVFLVLGLLPPPLSMVLFGMPVPAPFAYSGPWTLFTLPFFILGVVLAGGLIFLIVRAARRTPGGPLFDARTASAASEAPGASAHTGSGPVLAADARAMDAVVSDTASIPAPLSTTPHADDPGAVETPIAAASDDADPRSADAVAPPEDAAATGNGTDTDNGTGIGTDDAMDRWRAQHAAWKEQDQAWRREQQDVARAAREQMRRERQAHATAFAAETAERRRERQMSRPRTPFAFAAAVIGIAVVLGTWTALQAGGPLAPAHGLFVGALVLAAGMVAAGVARRRSGFLAFATMLALAGGGAALVVPTGTALHFASYGISNSSAQEYSAAAPFVQPWGDLSIYLDDTGRDGETHVQKRSGWTLVHVEPGVQLDLEFTTRSAGTDVIESDYTGTSGPGRELADVEGVTRDVLLDGRVRYRATLGSADSAAVTTRERLVITQETGYLDIDVRGPRSEGDDR
jgi:phage shock protein PspC (stress-responsive transcriptional regulator)